MAPPNTPPSPLAHFFSRYRRPKWRQTVARALRFGFTVGCAGFVAFVCEKRWPRSWWPNATPTPSPVAAKKTNAVADARTLGRMENLYRQHLEEVIQLIRSKPQYRMLALELPASALSFQRGIASAREGTAFHLQTKESRFPVLAISKSARPLLDQMVVDYIIPSSLPRKALEGALLPFHVQKLEEYLLVPDLTGKTRTCSRLKDSPEKIRKPNQRLAR